MVRPNAPCGARTLRAGKSCCQQKKKTMANVDVLNLNGDKVGTLELSDALFGPDSVNEALLWEAVKHYRASLRQGTHKTKSRAEVAGSGKKLWKQKGTGRARIGSVRSPLWRHGGTVHGPSRAAMTTLSRARNCWVRCALRLRQSWPKAS